MECVGDYRGECVEVTIEVSVWSVEVTVEVSVWSVEVTVEVSVLRC